MNQAFDSVAAPALPGGWTSAAISGTLTTWGTSTTTNSSPPNAAFIADTASTSENALVSPVFPVASSSAQLTFGQNYNLEFRKQGQNTSYYDGGVLEIKIGGGSFTDIITAGGSFVSGGYNATLNNGTPLGVRQAWSGNSGGWLTTTVNLPAAAAGQNIQLRWACGTDVNNNSGGVGWWVDSISISDTVLACCSSVSNTAPAFTLQPTGQVAIAGATATFSAAASGSPAPAYQWLFNATNLLAGKTSATLTLSNIQVSQAGGYSVTASNIAGIATSSVAQLTVLVPPSITGQPTNFTVISGSNATFNVTAAGSAPLSYQWQRAGTNLPGATATVLQMNGVQPAQAGSYRVIVTNSAGTVTSAVATLTVLVPPSVTIPPTNFTVISGSNASFNVTASGSAPLSYQWQFAGTNLPGATTTGLQMNNAQPTQAGGYRVIVTNTAGAVTSAVATLTVLVPPSITDQPTNLSVLSGSNASFHVTASGSVPLSYQWQFAGTNLPGATTTTLQMNNTQPAQAGAYRVIVTNTAGAVTSAVATLTVLVPPSITGQPTNLSVLSGSNATFTVTASGSASLAYQWQFAGTNLSGETTTALQFTNVQPVQAGDYSVIVTNAAGAVTSAVATLTVLVPPSITDQPTNLSVISGSDATFTVTASGSASLTYQWQFAGTNLSGETTTTLQLTNVQPAQAGDYNVIVTNSAGAVTSTVATLTLLMPPSITLQPTNLTVMPGSNAAFNVTASGSAPLAYQWQFAGTNLAGETATALQLSNVQPPQAGSYQVIVTNLAGAATSAPAALRILVTPEPGSLVLTGNTFSLSLPGVEGLIYTLEYKDVLTDLDWTPIPPSATGAGAILLLQDTNATVPYRFYRIRTE